MGIPTVIHYTSVVYITSGATPADRPRDTAHGGTALRAFRSHVTA